MKPATQISISNSNKHAVSVGGIIGKVINPSTAADAKNKVTMDGVVNNSSIQLANPQTESRLGGILGEMQSYSVIMKNTQNRGDRSTRCSPGARRSDRTSVFENKGDLSGPARKRPA